jgi:hypothetical protein
MDVSLKLSEIYTQTMGDWIFPVFMAALFAAFWGGYHQLFINGGFDTTQMISDKLNNQFYCNRI